MCHLYEHTYAECDHIRRGVTVICGHEKLDTHPPRRCPNYRTKRVGCAGACQDCQRRKVRKRKVKRFFKKLLERVRSEIRA